MGEAAVSRAVRFAKMHSMGNDFMVVDMVQRDAMLQDAMLDPATIRRWADRRKGVGFDQLLTLEPPHEPQCDFFSRIFNADGSQSGSCYNGARCLGLFIRREKLAATDVLQLEFTGGTVELRFVADGISLLSPPAQLGAQDAMFGAEAQSGGTVRLAGRDYQLWTAAAGNPHAIALADPDDTRALRAAGEQAQTHRWFPEGVNLSFVRSLGQDRLCGRTYERGAGITPACGSAAVAIASAALELGWAASPLQLAMADRDNPYLATLLPDGRMQLSGPAEFSYRGKLHQPGAEGEADETAGD